MKTTYLLPHRFKIPGWILFILGITTGIVLLFNDYGDDALPFKVFTIYNDPILDGSNGFFKIIENSILDELVSIAIIVGGLLLGFSREKVEDEYIYKLRKDSLAWAIVFNYLVLLFAIIFIYDFTFFHVLVFNMFTPLVFFIFRFNFLKFKATNHD